MDKQQFLDKVKEITIEMQDWIMKKAEESLKSGAFDINDYEDNYILPKIFISAMGEEIKFQYKPFDRKDVKTRDNLINFL
jgi:hypothetical protein